MEAYMTHISNYLLRQSWQIAVLVVVVAAISWLLRNKSAHVRYLLWLIVLAKCLVPPVATVPLAILPQENVSESALRLPVDELIGIAETMDTLDTEPPPRHIESGHKPLKPIVAERAIRLTVRQQLGVAWITGVMVFILMTVVKALRTELWLRRRRKLLPVGLQSEIEELFSSLDVRISPKIWLVEGIGQPFVWGVFRGGIYLPANFSKANKAEHCRSILGHELSHILRFDAAVNLLQIIAQAIFWFHPFVCWANKKIRAEREKCCDELTIAGFGTKARDYSKAIVNILISEQEQVRPVPSLAIAGPVENIEERIRTMLKPGKKFYKRPSMTAVIIVLLLAFFTVPTVLVLTARAEPDKNDLRISSAFEGRIEFHKPLAVGITSGTADYPELVRIKWIRFDKRYANAWGVTACVGWLPVKDATWQLTIELLDKDGNVLRHSRDEPTVFTGKASESSQKDMQYAKLDLGAMHDQGRRHAARFRILLESLEYQNADVGNHTFEIALVDQNNREPITNSSVVVSRAYFRDTFLRDKELYVTNAQGRCNITLNRDGLRVLGINAQKKDYCIMQKSWSNYGSSGFRAPVVNLPQRYILEMVRATALGGIVQDTEGNPIEDAEVRLETRVQEPSGTMNINCAVLTDKEGRWRVEGVPKEAERITLQLRHPEYSGNNGDSRRITGEALANARIFKHIEILEKGLTIKGRVLDDLGKPVVGATAVLSIRSYNPIYALTDATGTFRLVCSSDRSVYREIPFLIIEALGYAPVQQMVDIQPNQEALEFRLKRGRNVTCRVINTKGQPVVGAWTVVEPLEGNRDYSVWLKDTDNQGEFQIPNVLEQKVKLTVGKEGYIAIRDHVVSASEDEVVVTMKRALCVHGTVTEAETGEPIPNFEIATIYETGGRTFNDPSVAFTAGKYEISFSEARPETRQLQVSAVGYEPATSDRFNIDEGERVINFKLARSASFDEATAGRPQEQIKPAGPRKITGVVRDEQGKPVPDAIVVTYPNIGAETVTNATGAFTLKLRGMQGSMSRTMSRTIREEETTYLLVRQKERNLAAAVELDTSADTVDVTLAPGVILSGKVVDVEGKGIPSAELSLTFWISRGGYSSREITEIDKAGHYEIKAVPTEHRYSVNASADGYGTRYVEVNTYGAENQRLEVEPLVLSVANLSISGIVVDGFDQPVPDIRIYAYENGQPTRETFTDTKGRFTIENVCPGQIRIQANSQDRAPRQLHGRTRAEGGATDIKIVISERDSRGRPIPKQPPSLVGKSLPDFKDVNIDVLPVQAQDKILLICFFDMLQRPSRNCIIQLVKRAEELKRKGVIIIAIHVSKVKKNKLDDWVKKNNIPFPVGMAQGDETGMCFTWGVQAFPWLILTDRNHIVSLEGFKLDELDEKIKKADEK